MKRAGFTLVELLAVIGIIALLLAIIVPVLQRSRQQAKAMACSSNVRQLLLALFAFESANRHLPFGFDDTRKDPPPGGWPGNIAYDRTGWWWFNYIEGSFRKSQGRIHVLWCPSRQIRELQFEHVLHGNYGINTSVCKYATGRMSMAEFIGAPPALDKIANPSRTLLIVDSGYSIINWTNVTDVPPFKLSSMIEDTAYIPGMRLNEEKTNLWPGQMADALQGRHPGNTVNAGFVDGHVSREKADSLFVEKTTDGYKNRSPLWRPR
jgi:prepilin-type N-terminal cleavage/methylation domain-containing protein/prepilin-type processing-associated H-X9-DG protein